MNCFVFAHAMVSHKENSMRPNSFERERERKRVGKSLVSRRGLFSPHANAYSAKTKKKRGARLLLFFFFGRRVVVVFVVDTKTLPVSKETPMRAFGVNDKGLRNAFSNRPTTHKKSRDTLTFAFGTAAKDDDDDVIFLSSFLEEEPPPPPSSSWSSSSFPFSSKVVVIGKGQRLSLGVVV